MSDRSSSGPAVPVGGGVPVDPATGERYGYLPRKAAQRKLVIRAQLGLPWVLAAVAFAGVILVGGVALLLSRPDRPGPPYVDQWPLARYAEGDVTPLTDGSGWLDRRSGLVAVAGPVDHCPADGGWVDAEGQRYDLLGRSSVGNPGLALLPVRAANGRVYVDPTRPARRTGDGADLDPCPDRRRVTDPPPPDG